MLQGFITKITLCSDVLLVIVAPISLITEVNFQNQTYISYVDFIIPCNSPSGADPSVSSRLAEVYAHLEEIEADKAPAR